jgi:hypothetical protein
VRRYVQEITALALTCVALSIVLLVLIVWS